MTDNTELSEAQVHPSMPATYVEFIRQLWREQEKESRNTWSRQQVLARRPVFLKLLASERLGIELQGVYKTSVGPKIAQALTSQAVHIPELWMSEDKRTKKDQVIQFKTLTTAISAIKRVVALLDQDRTIPDEEDLTQHRRTTQFSSKLDSRAHRPVPLAFDDLRSEPLALSLRGGPKRVRLSIYDLNRILRAFDKPINRKIENIRKFRTHAADDPVLRYMGQITKGTPQVRHAVLLLDFSIDRYASDFRELNLSRDKLISAFVRTIYPTQDERVSTYQAVNRICSSRRKSITNGAT
jgi:hypothetical protein